MEVTLKAAKADDDGILVRATIDRPNGKTEYEGADELAEHLPGLNLTDLGTIILNAGWAHRGLFISVAFFTFRTDLDVKGSGDYHLLVQGVADDMIEEIQRGDRSLPHEQGIQRIAAAGFGGTLCGGLTSRLVDAPEQSVFWFSAAALFGLAFWFFDFIRPMFVPNRELLLPGARGRSERWGGRLQKVGGTALTLVIGAVLGVVFQKWLG